MTTPEDVTKLSRRLKSSADKLIKASDIIGILGEFGEVEFVGSYLNELLVWPDVDIHIYNPKANTQTAFAVAKAIYELETFKRAEIIKGEVARGNHKERGSWYFRTKAQEGDFRWNFDIWLFNRSREEYLNQNNNQKYLLDWTDSINSDQREVILRAKQQLIEQSQYFPGASVLVYEAVLENKLDTVDNIIEFVIHGEA